MSPRPLRALAPAALALVLSVGIAGCSGDPDEDPAGKDTGAPTTETESAPGPGAETDPADDLAFTFPDEFRGVPIKKNESQQEALRSEFETEVLYEKGLKILYVIWSPDDDIANYESGGADASFESREIGDGYCFDGPGEIPVCVLEVADGVMRIAGDVGGADSAIGFGLGTDEEVMAALEEMAGLVS